MITLNCLILEITRRCNMSCDHCLRGDAQAMDIDPKVIDKVLDQVESVGSIVFTGGEPTLNIPAIRYFTRAIKKRKLSLGYFYVVTNGKKESLPFVKALIDLYNICDNYDEEDFFGGLAVSKDQYHEAINPLKIYKVLKFYHPKENSGPIDSEQLLGEGRAAENYLTDKAPETLYKFNLEGDEDLYIEDLYVAANGNIVSNCNMSFNRIDKESFGNVLTESLENIIKNNKV